MVCRKPSLKYKPPPAYKSSYLILSRIAQEAGTPSLAASRRKRVPHLRDGFIVAKVGIRAQREPLFSSLQKSVIPTAVEGPAVAFVFGPIP
jgi:hypothetical protein